MKNHQQIPGQMSMTAAEIREALDRIEGDYPDSEKWTRPLGALDDARLIRGLADRLVAEQVAEARAIENPRQRVRLEQAGDDSQVRLSLVSHGTARDKRMYGWDVIGWVLGISGERARQRYGR